MFPPRLQTLQWLLVVLRIIVTPPSNRPLETSSTQSAEWPHPHSPSTATLAFSGVSAQHTHYHLWTWICYVLCLEHSSPKSASWGISVLLRDTHIDQYVFPAPTVQSLPWPRTYHYLNSYTHCSFSLNIMYTPEEQKLTCPHSPLWPRLLVLCLDQSNLKKCLLNECQISSSFLRENTYEIVMPKLLAMFAKTIHRMHF